MHKFSKKDILDFWLSGDESVLKGLDMNKLCHIWAEELGIELAADFDISEKNSRFFEKINTDKFVTCEAMDTLGYSVIDCELLTFDDEYALKRATELLVDNGGIGVVRGRRFIFSGYGTFIVKNQEEIKSALEKLKQLSLRNGKNIEPMFSIYRKAPIEYGIFMVGGNVEMVVCKVLNPITGLHNLSQGADSYALKDPKKLEELKSFCKDLNLHFNTAFMRVDVMDTENDGLRIVELSVPNFKKFSLTSEENYEEGKALFLKYYNEYLL